MGKLPELSGDNLSQRAWGEQWGMHVGENSGLFMSFIKAVQKMLSYFAEKTPEDGIR